MNKKILICILSLEEEPYISLEKTIRETWASKLHPDVGVVYYYGESNEIKMVDDKFYSNTPEGLYNIGYKTLNLFDYALNNMEFDYIFRTNSSSYVNIEKLLDFIMDKPKENFYSGVIGNYGGINFASGSGYFISRDLVELVVEQKNRWDHTLIDDVSLGKLMSENNVKIYRGERCDITNYSHIIKNHYHYRVKTENNRNNDIKLMFYLYDR
tara:strand:+ start:1024 stop:1659 length:636 start_codon:yes stop_codon:yes gene_type:complete